MLMPKRVKHRKQFRGSMAGKAMRGNQITHGTYGLVATEPCWLKIFPDKPVTAKPAETRMGSGKGTTEYWVAVVKPGRVLFEVAGVAEADAKEALRLAMHKLPCKCKIVSKEDVNGVNVVSAQTAEGGEQSENE